MTVQFIHSLLRKYFDGNSSLEEEKILRGYFSSTNIDAELLKYKAFFIFLNDEKSVEISDELTRRIESISDKKPTKMYAVKGNYGWWKMAAAVAFLIVSSYYLSTHFGREKTPQIAENQLVKKKAKVIVLDETTDPQMAFEEVEKALRLVSKNIKKGTDETAESLQKIKVVTKVINQ